MKLTLTINNGKVTTFAECKEITERYDLPLDLESLTIEQAQKLYNFINNNASEEYRAFMAGIDAPTHKAWSSKLKEYTAVVCAAMAEVTGIPLEAFTSLTFRQQRAFCDTFELRVIRPLYMVGLYEPQNIKSFEWEGVTYHLPKMTADGFGGLLPMIEETAESWAESNDLHLASENPYECMPLIVAILCRPEGEPYNELTARQRAEVFKQLPVSIAFEVFFSKLTQMLTSASLIGAYLEALQKRDQLKAAQAQASQSGSQC